ncbi:MAG: cbb3-type cytochrome c oxidase N-terminal domain-containing protein [Myxococcota bacterium]
MTKRPEDENPLTGHNYDGIEEYDNPMPKWWINIFIATVIFSGLYVIHYEFGSGAGVHEAYETEMLAFQASQEETNAGEEEITETSLAAFIKEPTAVEGGKAVYVTNCQSCHGAKGEGIIGPNLTDRYWLHGGGTLLGIHTVVSEGVLAKGMPAWNRVLAPNDLNSVVAFVGSLRGTNVQGKDPQGDPVEDDSGAGDEPDSDSTKGAERDEAVANNEEPADGEDR